MPMNHIVGKLIIVLCAGLIVACTAESAPAPTASPAVAVFTQATATITPTATIPTTITPIANLSTLTPTVELPAAAPTTEPTATQPRSANVNPLTGLTVTDPTVLERRPIMVRVGNDPGARPQVALNEADMVYEEMVEWWITRFTAIYLSYDPDTVAPIRSARLINVQLTPQYQGALASSGGSDPVRWEISQAEAMVNLDEFFVPMPYFYRPNEGWQTRLALNAQDARAYLQTSELDAAVNLRGFTFSPDIDVTMFPAEAVTQATEITVPYPPGTSEARWVYDADAGHYVRFTAGQAMLDVSGNQLTTTNVIVYFADHQDTDIVEDSNGATSIRIIMNGLGTAWLFRDGYVLKGNWETDGTETPRFFFNNQQPIPLKPGQTWVQVVPLDYIIDMDGVAHSRLGD